MDHKRHFLEVVRREGDYQNTLQPVLPLRGHKNEGLPLRNHIGQPTPKGNLLCPPVQLFHHLVVLEYFDRLYSHNLHLSRPFSSPKRPRQGHRLLNYRRGLFLRLDQIYHAAFVLRLQIRVFYVVG